MARNAMEKELLDLERQYWQAIKERDIDTILRLSDDPCLVTGAQGAATIDRKTMAAMMKAPSWKLEDFEVKDDAQVRMLRDDVAILAYKVSEKLTVEGKPVTLEAADASTWVRRNGSWVCALHAESVAGDPFGRDRNPANRPQS